MKEQLIDPIPFVTDAEAPLPSLAYVGLSFPTYCRSTECPRKLRGDEFFAVYLKEKGQPVKLIAIPRY